MYDVLETIRIIQYGIASPFLCIIGLSEWSKGRKAWGMFFLFCTMIVIMQQTALVLHRYGEGNPDLLAINTFFWSGLTVTVAIIGGRIAWQFAHQFCADCVDRILNLKG